MRGLYTDFEGLEEIAREGGVGDVAFFLFKDVCMYECLSCSVSGARMRCRGWVLSCSTGDYSD